jgi:exodeoxyribonuclease V beta subunit
MVDAAGDVPALVIACSAAQDLKADSYREFFAITARKISSPS